MTRDIEVQNPSATVFDDKEAVKQPKRCGRHGKEVERNSDLLMVLQKRKPLLTRIAAPAQTTQVSRDRSFGYDEAQFLYFAMDPRRSPRGIFGSNPLNDFPYFLVNLWPPSTTMRTPPPVQTKTGTVPAHYRFWLHDYQDIAPARPETPEHDPEYSIPGMDHWAWPFSFEDGNLLSKREDLKSDIGPIAEANADYGQDGNNAVSHSVIVITADEPF